jgi:hypothetical protein
VYNINKLLSIAGAFSRYIATAFAVPQALDEASLTVVSIFLDLSPISFEIISVARVICFETPDIITIYNSA